MFKLLVPLLLATLALPVRAAVVGRTVEYKDGDTTLRGYIAYDDATESKRPGVLVVHEWWGLNDYIKSRCQQLAQLGYVAFAADIYGEGFIAADARAAGQKAGEAKKNDWLRKRGALALAELKKGPRVDPDKLAAIGYCFGGGAVLELARAGEDLKGVVSFHGSLGTDRPAEAGKVKARVLVLTGAADPMVPESHVRALEEEMKKAGVDCKVVSYPNAKHAFTNPNADKAGIDGVSYNKEADEKSWEAMKAFFAELFGTANP